VNCNLQLVLLKEIPEDADLRRQWNGLAARVQRPQVFYTYEWALAVQRAYKAILHPLIFLARDEREELCGVAALAVDNGGQVSFLCATTGDYCDFLTSSEYKSAFVEKVLSELRKQGLDEIMLTNLPADSGSVAVIREVAPRLGYRQFMRTAYVCTQVVLDRLELRPDGAPALPRKKMVRRFLNAMGREAPVRLDHARGWVELEPILPSFMQAHVGRFLATGRISNMARPERRVFLTELAKLLSEPGWMTLTRMMSGKNAFAWNYGFQYRDTWFWYQPTFETDLEKYSPGFCLLAKLIEQAAASPQIKVVDMGLGAEEYKDRVANQTRETLYVTLKSSASRHYREIVRYEASRLVRTSPRAEIAVRHALQRWHHFRYSLRSGGMNAALRIVNARLRQLCWLHTEVFFYEWRGVGMDVGECDLRRLNLDELAAAACQYSDDPSTLDYLLRAAARLRSGQAQAYGLIDRAGKFVHFAWATDFEGFFLSELNARVDAPSPDTVMLFDCWTPLAARGHGYYAQAVGQVASIVRKQGKHAWIFSAAGNTASVKGLAKSGFERRYSLVRQRILGWQKIKGETPKSNAAPAAEVSAHV
jgi:CelD/BcsL family acetyltransferase involved in cellulose biosynthesis